MPIRSGTDVLRWSFGRPAFTCQPGSDTVAASQADGQQIRPKRQTDENGQVTGATYRARPFDGKAGNRDWRTGSKRYSWQASPYRGVHYQPGDDYAEGQGPTDDYTREIYVHGRIVGVLPYAVGDWVRGAAVRDGWLLVLTESALVVVSVNDALANDAALWSTVLTPVEIGETPASISPDATQWAWSTHWNRWTTLAVTFPAAGVLPTAVEGELIFPGGTVDSTTDSDTTGGLIGSGQYLYHIKPVASASPPNPLTAITNFDAQWVTQRDISESGEVTQEYIPGVQAREYYVDQTIQLAAVRDQGPTALTWAYGYFFSGSVWDSNPPAGNLSGAQITTHEEVTITITRHREVSQKSIDISTYISDETHVRHTVWRKTETITYPWGESVVAFDVTMENISSMQGHQDSAGGADTTDYSVTHNVTINGRTAYLFASTPDGSDSLPKLWMDFSGSLSGMFTSDEFDAGTYFLTENPQSSDFGGQLITPATGQIDYSFTGAGGVQVDGAFSGSHANLAAHVLFQRSGGIGTFPQYVIPTSGGPFSNGGELSSSLDIEGYNTSVSSVDITIARQFWDKNSNGSIFWYEMVQDAGGYTDPYNGTRLFYEGPFFCPTLANAQPLSFWWSTGAWSTSHDEIDIQNFVFHVDYSPDDGALVHNRADYVAVEDSSTIGAGTLSTVDSSGLTNSTLSDPLAQATGTLDVAIKDEAGEIARFTGAVGEGSVAVLWADPRFDAALWCQQGAGNQIDLALRVAGADVATGTVTGPLGWGLKVRAIDAQYGGGWAVVPLLRANDPANFITIYTLDFGAAALSVDDVPFAFVSLGMAGGETLNLLGGAGDSVDPVSLTELSGANPHFFPIGVK